MKKKHAEIYESTIHIKNLKHAKDVSKAQPENSERVPYTKEKFELLLCKWIVADDQVHHTFFFLFPCIF